MNSLLANIKTYHFRIGDEFEGSLRVLLSKLLFATFIGLAAYALDLGRQNPLYGVSIHFWDFFIILAALFLGPISSVCTALTLGLLLILGSNNIDFIGPYHLAILIGEGLFVGTLYRHKRPVRAFDGAVLYWLLIGVPIYSFLFLPILEVSATAYILDVLRYLGSAICSALLVQLLCLSPRISGYIDLFDYRANSEREWPATIIFNMYLVSLIVIPVFIWLQYTVIVADNELEKYLRNEMVDTVSRANSSIQRDVDQSFHFTDFLQKQYAEGGVRLFHSMADIIIPDRPEIAAIIVRDKEGEVLTHFGTPALLETMQGDLYFDAYGKLSEGRSIAFIGESLAVLRVTHAEAELETRSLLDLSRFTILSSFPATQDRSIRLSYTPGMPEALESIPLQARTVENSSQFWENPIEGGISELSHLGSRLSTTLNYSEPLARSRNHDVIYTVALLDLVNATIRVQLLTCVAGLIYVLAALVILRLTTLKAITRLRSVSRAANEWATSKSTSLNLTQQSSVREFNVLTESIENLMQGFVKENEKLSVVERELRAYSHKLNSIFDSVNGPLFVFNRRGDLLKANKSANDLCGGLSEGDKSVDIVKRMSPEWEPDQPKIAFNSALQGICTEGKEVFVRDSEGSRVALQMSWTPFKNGDDIDGVILSAVDITESIDSYNQLIHASKLATLGEMATGIAHELNQPLNIIRMAVENLELAKMRNVLNDTMLQEKIDRVTSQIDRAAEIVNHIRSFGRKSLDEKVPVDLIPCAANTVRLMQDQLSLDGIMIQFDPGKEGCVTLGDQVQVEQILINLISNARDAITENSISNGLVLLKISQQQSEIQIRVEDNGGGIPLKVLDQLFEPFFTTKPAGSGTGLGLSVTENIVTGMGGSIRALNENDGAVFVVTLPRCPNAQLSDIRIAS
ncbi:MAG: ATP-binding protein [Halieaceae bacterium]